MTTTELARWSVADVHESLDARSFSDARERAGAAFGLDVTSEEFWTASLDLVRSRIDDDAALAASATV